MAHQVFLRVAGVRNDNITSNDNNLTTVETQEATTGDETRIEQETQLQDSSSTISSGSYAKDDSIKPLMAKAVYN